MTATLLGLPAAAAGTNYTPVEAGNASFKKYLVIEDTANVPDLTFKYEVTTPSVTPTPATGKLNLYAGITAVVTPDPSDTDAVAVTYPTIDDVRFNEGYATVTPAPQGYAKYEKTITVDFGDGAVKFSEPGVYRYYIQETKESIAGLYYDVTETDLTTERDAIGRYRTLDVYVEDDTSDTTPTKKLKVVAYVMYEGMIDGTLAPSDLTGETGPQTPNGETGVISYPVNGTTVPGVDGKPKSDNYTNYYDTHSITFGKEVTGNQGSKDKYFKFTLSLSSPVAITCDVNRDYADTSLSDKGNSATSYDLTDLTNPQSIEITTPTGTPVRYTATADFYLQDGQYIVVNGLPEGVTYELTEAAEDYNSEAGIAAANSSINWDNNDETGTNGYDALADATSDTTGITADVHTGFTNSKNGIIPTGVLLKATPVIVIGLVILAGAAFFVVKNVRRKVVEAGEAEDSEE